jgi:hypothetical protein
MSIHDEAGQRAVHAAIDNYLDDGEIAISWCLVIDIAGPDDRRYLAHRAGGGHDGTDFPMACAALGMLRAGTQIAEDQLRECTTDTDEDE